MKNVKALHTRLQSLHLSGAEFAIKELFAQPWPHLRRLRLPDSWLEDRDVDLLMQMAPQVIDLEVGGFNLKQSLEQGECKWQHLALQCITCKTVMQLPLERLCTLRIHSISLLKDDWPHVQAATATLSGLTHIEVAQGCLEVSTGKDCFTQGSQVHQAVALLQALRQEHVKLVCGSFGMPVLQHSWLEVLKQLQCRTLSIFHDNMPDAWWAMLLQQLPQLQALHLMEPDRGLGCAFQVGVQVATFCILAPRPCMLKVDKKIARAMRHGWEDVLTF